MMKGSAMPSTLPLFAAALLVSAPVLASEVVPVQNFRSVQLRGGGAVEVVPGPAQRVTIVEGSGQFTRMHVEGDGKLIIDTCNQHCPQSYRLRVQIQSPRVPDLAISGGGVMVAAGGFAPQSRLAAAVNGGGRIDARSVEAGSVSAAVNGGGELLVRARESLSAAINGGGHVRYLGNPTTSIAIHGGGGVTRGD
jgi:Putative auto-transporter adhesin, head GIN domain